jgi:UPF0716 protein FxsA
VSTLGPGSPGSPGPAGGTPRARSRRRPAWGPLAVLVVVLLEVFVIAQVGGAIGAWWTFLLLLAGIVVGGWVVRREGARAWRALHESVAAGRPPGRELADHALVLVGGILLMVPGFVTDVLGVLLVLPLTRPAFRGLLMSWVGARAVQFVPPDVTRPGPGPGGPVIRGEVVDDEE